MHIHVNDWPRYPDPNFTSEENIFHQYSLQSHKHNRGPIIGLGAHSTARSIANTQYVLKETHTDYLQVDLLTRYAHPNIIGLKTFWVGHSIDRIANSDELSLFMILESGMAIPPPNRQNQAHVIYGLVRAILFLHHNGAIHGSIRSERGSASVTPTDAPIGRGSGIFGNGPILPNMGHLQRSLSHAASSFGTAGQLGSPRGGPREHPKDTPAHIRNIAGSIVMFLKGVVYPPNLFTGIRDPHVLSERLETLTHPERYCLAHVHGATLRIPISLL